MRTVLAAMALACGLAGDARADLVVRGDACPGLDVRGEVATLLGHDPFGAGDAPSIVIEIEGTDRGLSTSVKIADRPRRLVDVTDCTEARASLAVIVAVALRTAPPPPAKAPVVVSSAPVLEVAARALPERASLTAELGLVVAVQRSSGGWTSALVPALGVRRGRTSIAVAGELYGAERVQLAHVMASAHVRRLGLSATACRHDLPIALCVVGSAGVVRGRGEGLAVARTSTEPTAALGGRASWTYWIGRVGVAAHVDVRVNLRTVSFLVDDAHVWESRRFEAWAGIGVVARIP